MAAPQIPPQATLETLNEESSFTAGQLQSHPLALPFTTQFDAFQATWITTNNARIALQTAIHKADGVVVGADAALDDFVDVLDRTLLIAVKNDRQAALYQLYFGLKTPSELKRPKLGDELATVKNWVTSIAASTTPAIAALAPALTAVIAAADAAIVQKAAAVQALKDFDNIGGKKQLIDAFNALRQSVFGDLAALPHENPDAMLPADFADRFFRHQANKGIQALTNPDDVQDRIDVIQAELTAAQNHKANLLTTIANKAAAKVAAQTAEDALVEARKETAAAKEKEKAAAEAAEKAKKATK